MPCLALPLLIRGTYQPREIDLRAHVEDQLGTSIFVSYISTQVVLKETPSSSSPINENSPPLLRFPISHLAVYPKAPHLNSLTVLFIERSVHPPFTISTHQRCVNGIE